MVISPSELYMKDRGIHAGNVTIRQRLRVISLKTSDLYTSHPTRYLKKIKIYIFRLLVDRCGELPVIHER